MMLNNTLGTNDSGDDDDDDYGPFCFMLLLYKNRLVGGIDHRVEVAEVRNSWTPVIFMVGVVVTLSSNVSSTANIFSRS